MLFGGSAAGQMPGRAFSIQASLRVERSSCKLLFSIVSPHLEIVILSEGRAKRKPESKDLAINESPFYDHGLERQKEILRRGQRPCSG